MKRYLRPAAFALALVWCVTGGILAAVPPAIAALLPKSAVVTSGSWSGDVRATTGSVHAELRGIESGCDMTVGSDVRLSLKHFSEGMAPLLPSMQREQTQSVEKARTELQTFSSQKKKNGGLVTSVGEVVEEAVAGGRIVYYEYTENCAKRPNHRTTELRGFANKGSVFSNFFLTVTAPASEARTLAIEILTKLQQFTPPPATSK